MKLPPDLEALAELRAKETGYKSWGAYLKGLLRYDALCRSTHSVTIAWSELPLEDQDKVDAKLLARAQKGQGMRAAEAAKVDWRTL